MGKLLMTRTHPTGRVIFANLFTQHARQINQINCVFRTPNRWGNVKRFSSWVFQQPLGQDRLSSKKLLAKLAKSGNSIFLPENCAMYNRIRYGIDLNEKLGWSRWTQIVLTTTNLGVIRKNKFSKILQIGKEHFFSGKLCYVQLI